MQTELTIINKLGLHARAASKLVQMAARFSSKVEIESKGVRVNAKSIMGVMMLAASKGTVVQLYVEGDDAEAASEAITQLFAERFGEAE